MIIPFDQNKWERAGAAVKVDKFLRNMGCDPKYPVNVSNIFTNMGFDIYVSDDSDFFAKFTYNENDKCFIVNRRIQKLKKNYIELKAFIISIVNHYQKIAEQNLKVRTKEALDNARFVYEETVDFNEIDEYRALQTHEERKAFKKKYMDDLVETFFEDHAPDDFVELDINIPRNYKETIIYNNDQAEKEYDHNKRHRCTCRDTGILLQNCGQGAASTRCCFPICAALSISACSPPGGFLSASGSCKSRCAGL